MLVAGKFEVVRELGRGAFGVVYEARDRYLDRAVAIKTIRDDHFSSASSREAFEKRFLREARSVARLQHPNIISVYEAGRDGEMSFIAMEFVRGKTLRDVLAARRLLPPGEVLAVAEALLSALDYAHTQGIVHRDIKPENVMVREDGALKVADFGIAKALHAESTTLTKDGAVMGTPSYMPPEQVLGKPVDGRADMFSAAALLYECLTGEKPFAGDNLPALVHQILTASPRPVAPSLRVPPHMLAAVMRGLAKEPDQRFRTCGELLAALRGTSPGTATIDHNRTLPEAPAPRASGHTFQGVLSQLPDPHAATLPGQAGAGRGGSSLLAIGVAAAIFIGLLLLTGGAVAVYLLVRPAPRVADRPAAGSPTLSPRPASPPERTTPPSPASPSPPRDAGRPPEVAPPRSSPPPPAADDGADDDAPLVADPADQARAELDAMAALVRRQIESGNWNNLADHYASDAVIVNGDGTFAGRGTIDAYFRTAAAVLLATAPGQPISWGYRWLEFDSDGRTAVALTENTFHVGGTLVDHSVTRVSYRKSGGRWLITRAEWQPGMDPATVEARGRSDGKKKDKRKKDAEEEEEDGGGIEIDLTLPRKLPRRLPLPGR